jgi:uncharacterized cysteine cluster protein YcgN (CxxCxxCC family)
MALAKSEEVWQETVCNSCGNCCKIMKPTFSTKDVKRIVAHFEMSPATFNDTYLYKDTSGG